MRIAIAADHEGYLLKEELLRFLQELGHEMHDLGTHSTESVDYPRFAEAVGLELTTGRADRGILVCGSGVGVTVAANKIPGIRCGMCHDYYSAHQSVEHDDANVIALGSRVVGAAVAKELVQAFLDARFSGLERHRRRLDQIKEMENRYCRALVGESAEKA